MKWVYVVQRKDNGLICGVYYTRKQADTSIYLRCEPADYKIIPWAVTTHDS